MKKLIIFFITIFYAYAINILILNSYSPDLRWTEIQSNTLVDNLRNLNIKNKHIFIEFMDTKKFPPTPERIKNFLDYLNKKYEKINFDIVIVTDDNALNFVKKYKNIPLFKKAKIFFQGINNLNLYNKLDKHIYAGIFEKKEPLLQLEFAKKVMPNLKTIYMLSDVSVSGNKISNQYQKTFKNIKGFKFVYIRESDLDNILERLKDYDKNSVLMLLTFTVIKKGNKVLEPYDVEKYISKVYKNPILVHADVWTTSKDTNIIGGVCTDAKTQSILNLEKLKKYLNGIPMENIGFQLSNISKLFINVKNIRKFGIDETKIRVNNLPVKYVNEPTSFYEKYKKEIWITIFASTLFILFLITIFLLILFKKNKELKDYFDLLKTVFEYQSNKLVLFNKEYKILFSNIKNKELLDLLKEKVENSQNILHYKDKTYKLDIKKIDNFILANSSDITSLHKELNKIKNQSLIDSLTNAYNRKKLDYILKTLNNKNICLIMIDIDNFKRINDTYGHLKGDLVLKTLSKVIQNNIKESDVFVRWGGEEFLILISESNIEQAKNLAETLRKLISDIYLEEIGHFTCSFGISCGIFNNNFNEILEKADKALYKAKKNGKNRVEVYKD